MTRRSALGVSVAIVAATASLAGADRRGITIPRAHLSAKPAQPREASSKIIYLHRCQNHNCIFTPGDDDSRTNTSSLVSQQVFLDDFTGGDAVWADLLACVKDNYAAFGVTITDVDPGPDVPHFENIVGGTPDQLHNAQIDSQTTAGVSPFDCQEIPNAITFTFDVVGPSPSLLCWTASQETAHGIGLDYEAYDPDPMTYLNGVQPKYFKHFDAPCGEYAARPCKCGGTTQNSYQAILAAFGKGNPLPPEVHITYPPAGKHLQAGFRAHLDATDRNGVDRVELWVDGVKGAMATTEPYTVFAPPDLALGPHTIEARAYDGQDTVGTTSVDVTIDPPCTASAGCSDGDVCVMGHCVAGPTVAGGLGDGCTTDRECLEQRCDHQTEGGLACAAECDPATAGACPSGFACGDTGNGGVHACLVDGGGCCSGSGGRGSLLLSALVLGLVLRRRP